MRRPKHQAISNFRRWRRAQRLKGLRRGTAMRGAGHARRGSTLLIVMVLLGMLSLLGVLFFSFASQEKSNAEYYSEGAKSPDDPGLTADTLMNWALQQIVVGTDPRLKNSALWGSRHAMLAGVIGIGDHRYDDGGLYNGQGVHLIPGRSAAQPAVLVDQNRDGLADGDTNGDLTLNVSPAPYIVRRSESGVITTRSVNTGTNATPANPSGTALVSDLQQLSQVNDSPAAWNGFERPVRDFPQPDVDYTYPDHNNLFLSYDAYVRDEDRNGDGLLGDDSNGDTAEDVGGAIRRIIIPSYHRPSLLRSDVLTPFPHSAAVATSPGTLGSTKTPGLEWFERQESSTRSLRVNPFHRYIFPQGPPPGVSALPSRFIPYGTAAVGVSAFPFMDTPAGYAGNPFPFRPMSSTYTNTTPDYANGAQGVWSPGSTASHSDPNTPLYQYDMDADGDGVREAVFIDLDFPVQEGRSGELYVPIFAVTIKDLNGLIDLNSHGNLHALFHGGRPLNNAEDRDGADGPDPFGGDFATAPFDQDSFWISRSNQGLGPAEVNPAWALTGRPNPVASNAAATGIMEGDRGPAATSPFEQHNRFYSREPEQGQLALPGHSSAYAGASPAPPAITNKPFRGSARNARELANMELSWLKLGRPKLSGSYASPAVQEVYPGVYGEDYLIERRLADRGPAGNNLYARYFPHPGRSGVDDNGDRYEGTFPFFGTPLDYSGYGSMTGAYTAPLGNRKGLSLSNLGIGGNIRWQQFQSYSMHDAVAGAAIASGSTNRTWWDFWNGSGLVDAAPLITNLSTINPAWVLSSPITPFLIAAGTTNQPVLVDDPYEVAFYATDRSDVDDPFPPADTAYLQLTNADLDLAGVTSRVGDLAAFNFAKNDTINSRNDQIRRKFTTVHNDRKNFSIPAPPLDVTPLDYPLGADTAAELDTPGEWEWSFDSVASLNAARLRRKFPPEFGPIAASAAAPRVFRYYEEADLDGSNTITGTEKPAEWPAGNANPFNVAPFATRWVSDPLRTPVRYLLEMEEKGDRVDRPQRRLALNQLLVWDAARRQYRYRALTPHPEPLDAVSAASFSAATIPASVIATYSDPSQIPFDDLISQEFWARRDRQQLCRDIYVIGCLLAGDMDDATPGYQPACNVSMAANESTKAKARQMAQFAVNLVDSMDADRVVTKFEFDLDLTDGWNLDDNPYTPTTDSGWSGSVATTTLQPTGEMGATLTQRETVFGIERMDLALNEALVIATEEYDNGMALTDVAWTEYNDDAKHRYTFIELQNLQPNAAGGGSTFSFANFVNDGKWMVEVRPEPHALNKANWRRFIIKGGSLWSPSAGGQFVIASADDIGGGDSIFRADPMGMTGSSYVQIVPASDLVPNVDTRGSTPASNFFELLNGLDSSPVTLTGSAPGSRALLSAASLPKTGGNYPDVEVVLKRRANPYRISPSLASDAEQADNPWVEVDRFMIKGGAAGSGDIREVAATPSQDQNTVQNNILGRLQSRERTQPYVGATADLADHDQTPNTVAPAVPPSSDWPNSFGVQNQKFSAAQSIVHLHGDRNFASTFELLSVPVVPPVELTSKLLSTARSYPQGTSAAPVANKAPGNFGQRLLQPDSTNQASATTRLPPPPDPAVTTTNADGYYSALTFPYAGTSVAQLSAPLGESHQTAPLAPIIGPFTDAAQYEDRYERALARGTNSRWHRLLELIETPTRSHRGLDLDGQPGLDEELSVARLPGRINLNGVRHPEVLAALIDDHRFADFELEPKLVGASQANSVKGDNTTTYDYNGLPSTDAAVGANPLLFPAAGLPPFDIMTQGRNLLEAGRVTRVLPNIPATSAAFPPNARREDLWTYDFLGIRDADPLRPAFPLAGGLTSRPFHGFGRLDRSVHYPVALVNPLLGVNMPAIENSLYRARWTQTANYSGGATPITPTTTEITDSPSQPRWLAIEQNSAANIDSTVNHGLYSKIANNSGTRSHTFGVWIAVKLFKAVSDNANGSAIRIGEPLNNNADPEYRGFFVVDRSLIEQATKSSASSINTFRPFITHRKILKEPTN